MSFGIIGPVSCQPISRAVLVLVPRAGPAAQALYRPCLVPALTLWCRARAMPGPCFFGSCSCWPSGLAHLANYSENLEPVSCNLQMLGLGVLGKYFCQEIEFDLHCSIELVDLPKLSSSREPLLNCVETYVSKGKISCTTILSVITNPRPSHQSFLLQQ